MTDSPAASTTPGWIIRLARWWNTFASGLAEYYNAPYRRTLAKAARDTDDMFMLMVMGQALGLDNPVEYYTLELAPVLWEDFHDWHRRMGLEHSPLEGISCC